MLYSDLSEGDRRAVINIVRRSEWAKEFDLWEVTMYINNRPIQITPVRDAEEASRLAEDFVRGGSSGPVLLKESFF